MSGMSAGEGIGSGERLSDAIEAELEEAGLVEAPDGGWGWAIVAASFLANAIVDGVIFTSGAAFMPQWEREFGASYSQTAWTVSLLSGGYLLSGPIASALANIYGCRIVTAAGCLISVTGFVLSMFAPSLWFLYITFGAIGGIGFGLMYLPSIVIVSFYFKRRRALATGLAVCGSGIGTFLFAPLSQLLMEQYNWNQALLIIAGICLNGLVAAAVYRPLEPSRREVERVEAVMNKYSDLLGADGEAQTARMLSQEDVVPEMPLVTQGIAIERFDAGSRLRNRTTSEHPFTSVVELRARARNASVLSVRGRLPSSSSTAIDADAPAARRQVAADSVALLNRPLSRADIFYTGSLAGGLNASLHAGLERRAGRSSSRNLEFPATSVLSMAPPLAEGEGWKAHLKATLSTMIDFRLLRSFTFLLLSLEGFLTLAGFFVPFIFLPAHAISIGHSEADATFLISILGIANIVFRVACGWLSDQPWLDCLVLHNAALVAGGVGTILIPFYQPYWLLVLYCLLFGLATACFASLRSVICAELLGLSRLTSAFGLSLLFMGVAALVGAPIAGALADATGNLNTSFYVMGASIALSGIIGIPLRRLSRWEFQDELLPESQPSAPDMETTPLQVTPSPLPKSCNPSMCKV